MNSGEEQEDTLITLLRSILVGQRGAISYLLDQCQKEGVNNTARIRAAALLLAPVDLPDTTLYDKGSGVLLKGSEELRGEYSKTINQLIDAKLRAVKVLQAIVSKPDALDVDRLYAARVLLRHRQGQPG